MSMQFLNSVAWDGIASGAGEYTGVFDFDTWTASLWVNGNAGNSVLFDTTFFADSPRYGITVRHESGEIVKVAEDFTTTNLSVTSPTGSLPWNSLHHLVITRDSTSHVNPTVYVDGVSYSTSGTSSAGTRQSHSGRLAFGHNTINGNNRYTGKIAHFGFWNRVLSADEIAALGRISPLGIPQGLTSYIDMLGAEPRDRLVASTLTRTNTVQSSEEPRIIMPTATILPFAAPAAGGKTVVVGTAAETDSAVAVTASRAYSVGTPAETDAASAISALRARAVGTASETDAATGITPNRARAIGTAAESDTAPAISASLGGAVGTAVESDTASNVIPLRSYAVGPAVETEAAQGIAARRSIAVGLVVESDIASTLTALRTLTLGLASESDSASAIGFTGPTLATASIEYTLNARHAHYTLPERRLQYR